MPIGTVQWKAFNAKKKLAPFLKPAKTLRGTICREFRNQELFRHWEW